MNKESKEFVEEYRQYYKHDLTHLSDEELLTHLISENAMGHRSIEIGQWDSTTGTPEEIEIPTCLCEEFGVDKRLY